MASRLLQSSIIMDLSVVTVSHSLSAVGSWEEVLLLSMDFSVPKHLGVRATGCEFVLVKKPLLS